MSLKYETKARLYDIFYYINFLHFIKRDHLNICSQINAFLYRRHQRLILCIFDFRIISAQLKFKWVLGWQVDTWYRNSIFQLEQTEFADVCQINEKNNWTVLNFYSFVTSVCKTVFVYCRLRTNIWVVTSQRVKLDYSRKINDFPIGVRNELRVLIWYS